MSTQAVKEEGVPANVERALFVLDNMEHMVQAVVQSAGLRAEHWNWLSQVKRLSGSPKHRSSLARLLVLGPMEDLSDGKSDIAHERRKVFACALLEAALFEQQESGFFEPQRLKHALLDWLKLGAWRSARKSPLTEIGRVVESVSRTPDEAVATRLGLLVPFWSSLALWCLHADFSP